jgi:hypothetical protein
LFVIEGVFMPRTRAAWEAFVDEAQDWAITKDTVRYILADWKRSDESIQAVLTQNETVIKEKG